MVAAAVVCSLLAAPRAARACSKRHQTLFELYDLARDVAVVKVTAGPGPRGAGPVALAVKQRLKGPRRAALSARETNTSCQTGYRRGRTALVFLRADRWTAGDYEGYLERPDPAVLDALRAWGAAATDADRLAVLLSLVTSPLPALRYDAANYLVDHPALINALSDAQGAALAAAVRGDRADRLIVAAVARQHGKAWRDLLATRPRPALDKAVQALADHDLEAVTDVGQLADLIATTKGEYAPERIAAAERCERVHGHLLVEFSRYAIGRSDQGWAQLAEACRTGVSPPYH